MVLLLTAAAVAAAVGRRVIDGTRLPMQRAARCASDRTPVGRDAAAAATAACAVAAEGGGGSGTPATAGTDTLNAFIIISLASIGVHTSTHVYVVPFRTPHLMVPRLARNFILKLS